jgi:uncharacterized protein with HEPN domain
MQQEKPSMQPDARKYLLDALNACEAITTFTRQVLLEDYSANLLLRSAVERQLEILGEAFSQLDNIEPDYRRQYPDMGKIIGMRNRIIHGYDSVDDAIVWDAVKQHIPKLKDWLSSLHL